MNNIGRPTCCRLKMLRGEQIVFVSNKAEYKEFNGVLNGEVGLSSGLLRRVVW
jgi:hypothetical protein